MTPQLFIVTPETAGAVLGALRKLAVDLTWSAARKHLAGRRITVNGILCVDEGRRVVAGDAIEVRTQPLPPPPRDEDVQILHLDSQVVVVNKPAGMLSLRHPGDVKWRQERRDLQPSLEECLARLIARRENRRDSSTVELLAVHRIDRETSGAGLCPNGIRSDTSHRTVRDAYVVSAAISVLFRVEPEAQTISTTFVRDRGDGVRGSSPDGIHGKRAVTHVTSAAHDRRLCRA